MPKTGLGLSGANIISRGFKTTEIISNDARTDVRRADVFTILNARKVARVGRARIWREEYDLITNP